ncbi:hypothetical protein J8J42_12820 [Chryseobacterium sp. cx-311]|uniref:hypothetical protein n=1 Tax=Marnyiella aurantia TaxID=2758037 RepID=UPI001AE4C490|nr:hypothetical protein [Marnyiella aurantia]MBP0613921.1 hypothetical protein [Marnyiella aurantia]
MKKKFSVLLACLVMIFSCNDEDFNQIPTVESSGIAIPTIYSKTHISTSVGESHNLHLGDMYEYLSTQNNLDSSNIHQYAHTFFGSMDNGELASEDYDFVKNNGSYSSLLSSDFNAEISRLNQMLEASDFSDINEFKNYMYNYTPIHITDKNELIAWEYYADTFFHSFEYWSNNIDNWNTLIVSNNSAGNPVAASNSYPICGVYSSWWKRTWCNVGVFAGVDAASAGVKALVALISGSPIVFGTIVASAVGASASSVIASIVSNL